MDTTQRIHNKLISKFDTWSTKNDSHEESIHLLKSQGGNGSCPHPLRICSYLEWISWLRRGSHGPFIWRDTRANAHVVHLGRCTRHTIWQVTVQSHPKVVDISAFWCGGTVLPSLRGGYEIYYIFYTIGQDFLGSICCNINQKSSLSLNIGNSWQRSN